MQPMKPTHRISIIVRPIESEASVINYQLFIASDSMEAAVQRADAMARSGQLIGLQNYATLDVNLVEIISVEVTDLDADTWTKAHLAVLEQLIGQQRAQTIAATTGPKILPAGMMGRG